MKLNTKKFLAFTAVTLLAGIPLLTYGQYDPARGIGAAQLEDTPVVDIVETLLLWLLLILTYIAVIGFVISGIMYITAGGSGRAEEAKKWMVFSIIGITVALSGYIVVRLVSDTLANTVN